MTQHSKDRWELPESFKKDWIEALKSGNYTQGAGALRGELGDTGTVAYCCLGVACSVAGVESIDIHGEWIEDFDNNFDDIPTILKGCSDDSELVRILSEMNDKMGKTGENLNKHSNSFNDIADWINIYIGGI